MSGASPIPCPCCGHATLSERGGFEICPVCFWEDDGLEGPGGPNHLSLSEGRRNYLTFGAAEARDLQHVRPPRPDEPRLRVFVLRGEIVEEVGDPPCQPRG